jgi:hypothetical protein
MIINRVIGLVMLSLITTSVSAVDPHNFSPFSSSPEFPYKPAVCDQFLARHSEIRYLSPQPRAKRILSVCSKQLDSYFEAAPGSDQTVYQVDLDNDGVSDTTLYSIWVFPTSAQSEGFYKIDPKSCSVTPVFTAYLRNRLFRLGDKTYIEATHHCVLNYRVDKATKDSMCTAIFLPTVGAEIKERRDELCLFIKKPMPRGAKPR